MSPARRNEKKGVVLRAGIGQRGEDQPRLLIFFFVAAALAGIITMLVVVIVLASTNTSKAVLNEQKDVNMYSSTVVQGLASILNLRFVGSESASCIGNDDFQRPVILTMRFRTERLPQRCDFFVNGALIKTERRLEADCGAQCPFTEFNRQFSLGNLDYRDDHTIKVCCDDICVERTLERICLPTNS